MAAEESLKKLIHLCRPDFKMYTLAQSRPRSSKTERQPRHRRSNAKLKTCWRFPEEIPNVNGNAHDRHRSEANLFSV